MSKDDLVRRGDALAAVQGFEYGWHAEEVIAALPASHDPAAIREAAQMERMQNLIDAYEDIMDYGIVFAKREQQDRLKAAKDKLNE